MQSDLMDFHPYDTGLVPQVLSFVQEYQNHIPERKPCGRDEFIALLAGIAALRRTPGIPAPSEISFTALPQCASSEEEAACRTHLERTFGIQDRESLPWLGDADLDAGLSCTDLLTSCRRRRPVRGKRLCCLGAIPGSRFVLPVFLQPLQRGLGFRVPLFGGLFIPFRSRIHIRLHAPSGFVA